MGKRIVYMDEVTFGSWTIPTCEWSASRSNITVPTQLTTQKTVKAIVGMSYQRGLEPYTIFTDKLDSEQVIDWLVNLLAEENDKPVVFLDNASWHTSFTTASKFAELGVDSIFNLAAQPRYMPFELLFAMAKQWYRKQRLLHIQLGEKPDPVLLVEQALQSVPKAVMQS